LGAVAEHPGNLPRRVKEYTSRVSECIDWSKQVDSGTGDPVKAAEIARAIQALHCKDLQAEAFFLHREYKNHTSAVQAVDAATKAWMKTIGKPPEDDPSEATESGKTK
jgi:hypothetical protein